MNVLAIAGSPRRGGNTDVLLERVVTGAVGAGASVERFVLCQMNITPCRGCNRCFATGRCVVNDGFQTLYDRTLAADAVALASPVFFTNVSAQVKAFIDRFQCLWAMKYVLKQPLTPPPGAGRRKAAFVSAAGAPRMSFACTLTTVRAFCATIDAKLIGTVCVNGTDEAAAVCSRPDVLARAEALGARLVAPVQSQHIGEQNIHEE